MKSSTSALIAVAMAGLGIASTALPAPRKGSSSRDYTPPRQAYALSREIADHNAEVDLRKAKKRARKRL